MADITIAASAGAPALTAFRNIQFIAAWSDSGATAINALPLAMSAGASGPSFLVNVPTQTNPRREWPAIVECAAGFVIAWIDFTLGDPAGNVKLRIFDADTFSPGDEIQVNAAPVDHNQPPQLANLSDGGSLLFGQTHAPISAFARSVSTVSATETALTFAPIRLPACIAARSSRACPAETS